MAIPDGPYVIVIVEFRWSATMEPVITSVYEAMHMVISTAHAAGTNLDDARLHP